MFVLFCFVFTHSLGILQAQCVHKLPRDLITMKTDSLSVRWDLRSCTSIKLPDETYVAGLLAHLEYSDESLWKNDLFLLLWFHFRNVSQGLDASESPGGLGNHRFLYLDCGGSTHVVTLRRTKDIHISACKNSETGSLHYFFQMHVNLQLSQNNNKKNPVNPPHNTDC